MDTLLAKPSTTFLLVPFAGELVAMMSFLVVAARAADDLAALLTPMHARASRATDRSHREADRLLAALVRVHCTIKSALSDRFQLFHDKMLTERAEEAGANASLMESVRALAFSAAPPMGLLDNMLTLDKLLFSNSVTSILLPVCDASDASLLGWASIWRDSIDASLCTISGPGSLGFVSGAAADNHIVVSPRIATNLIAEFVTVDDVCVLVEDERHDDCGYAAVSVHEHQIHIHFSVPTPPVDSHVYIRVFVCGICLWSSVLLPLTVRLKHMSDLLADRSSPRSMVVTPDRQYLMVSHYYTQELCLYRIEADFNVKLLQTLELTPNSGRMCTTPSGNLLVCSTKCVQEFARLGLSSECRLVPLRCIEIPALREYQETTAIAVHNDLIAVGASSGEIFLLSYPCGSLIRVIGFSKDGYGTWQRLGSTCLGICFSPDGNCILACEHQYKRLTLFSIGDGSFVQHVGAGIVETGCHDVGIVASGEVFVADRGNNRICLLSADGKSLVRAWNKYRDAVSNRYRDFDCPSELSLVGRTLFVLDSAGIHVFDIYG